MARTRDANSNPNNFIPKSYEELYRYYILGDGRGNSLACQLIRKFVPYATQDESQSLLHDVFLRCFEKKVLDLFDPTKANFGGVIFFVTRSICVNHLDRKTRNPLTGLNGGTLTNADPEDQVFEPGVYSLDKIFGTEAPNYEEEMEARSVVEQLFAWAKSLYEKPAHKRDASLYPLLQMLAIQREPDECSKELGVTVSTIHNWLTVLRQKTREIKEARG